MLMRGKPSLVLSHSEKDAPLSRCEWTKQGDPVGDWEYVGGRGRGSADETGDGPSVRLVME